MTRRTDNCSGEVSDVSFGDLEGYFTAATNLGLLFLFSSCNENHNCQQSGKTIWYRNVHAWIQRGGEGDRGSGPLMKNHKFIGFPSNTCLGPLINHKATKQAFNVGPLSASQRNAI